MEKHVATYISLVSTYMVKEPTRTSLCAVNEVDGASAKVAVSLSGSEDEVIGPHWMNELCNLGLKEYGECS